MRNNPEIQKYKYTPSLSLQKSLISGKAFGRFVSLYFLLLAAALIIETTIAIYAPKLLPAWSKYSETTKELLSDATGYLITAQVGVLAIVSLAVGLISIIAEREGSGATIEIYYNQSMASEVLASNLALLTVLSIQILWPAHFSLHLLGLGTSMLTYKAFLTTFHLLWLCVNLAGARSFHCLKLSICPHWLPQSYQDAIHG